MLKPSLAASTMGSSGPFSNWSMLDVLLNTLQIDVDWGSEITVVDRSVGVLTEALAGAQFTCVLETLVERRGALAHARH
jgi:hypothetical protein